MNMEASAIVDLVTYHRDGHVGFITLNRPEKRNAMSVALWNALDQAVGMAGEDPEARVVLLRGSGKSFCAGLDLSPDNEVIATITGQGDCFPKGDLLQGGQTHSGNSHTAGTSIAAHDCGNSRPLPRRGTGTCPVLRHTSLFRGNRVCPSRGYACHHHRCRRPPASSQSGRARACT